MSLCHIANLHISTYQLIRNSIFCFFNDGRGDVTLTLMFSVGYDYRMQMKFLVFKYKGPLLIFSNSK
jgi:hypothetical protein